MPIDGIHPEARAALEVAPAAGRAAALSLIARLAQVPGLAACYLSGSFGKGIADRFSDVDLVVFGSDPEQLDLIRAAAREVTSPVLDKTLGRGVEGVVTIVTPQWLRLDIACRAVTDHSPLRREDVALCWTRLAEEPVWASEDSLVLGNPAAAFEEAGRMMGLLPVLLGRGDPVTAMAGCGLLLTRLIELNRLLLGRQCGGAMAVRRDLPSHAYARLRDLPELSPTHESVLAFHVALWEQFVQLVQTHGELLIDDRTQQLCLALREVYRRDLGVELLVL